MTVQELIDKLQALPGDLSLLPVQVQEVFKRNGFRETHEYAIQSVHREPMAICLVKDVRHL